MSFLAKLTIEEEEMNVLECSYEFTQQVGADGRPIEMPRAGLIHVLLESTNSTSNLAWMIFPDTYKDGEIVFFKRDNMTSNKTLRFYDAFCVSYQEVFSAQDSTPMKTRIAISSRAIDVNDVSYENSWDVV